MPVQLKKKKKTRRFARCILRQMISHASFLSRIEVYQKRLKHDDIGVVPVPKFHSVRLPKKDTS